MRRILLASTLFVSACATAPQPPAAPQPQPILTPVRHDTRGGLIGLGAAELVGQLGAPALQLREGSSVKFQFRGQRCVLDAYLYPQSGTDLRVVHVDARLASGLATDQAACVSALSTGN